MLPLSVPNLIGREAEYLQECITSTFVSSVGPFVDRFERMVAEATGAPFAVATSAGTTALHAALVAVGVSHQDLVIVPTLTFIASANAVAHCGADPWLFDVDTASWTLDTELLRQRLASETRLEARGLIHTASGRRVAAIVPVHTLGAPADMDTICAIAGQYGLPVVVDGAAAIGATYKGRAIGDVGDCVTMISFNGNKTVTSGGGGAIVGTDRDLCQRIRHLSATARVGSDYDHDRVGFNYRMTNLQAAVGCAQMENLGIFVARKRAIRARYNDALRKLNGVELFPEPEWGESACWLSGIRLRSGHAGRLREALREANIDSRPFWKPMHHQRPFAKAHVALTGVADGLWQDIVVLPCSTGLTEEDQGRVIDKVLEVASRI